MDHGIAAQDSIEARVPAMIKIFSVPQCLCGLTVGCGRSSPRRWRDALDNRDLKGSGRGFEYQSELVAQGGSK